MLSSVKMTAKELFGSMRMPKGTEGDEDDFGEDMGGEIALLEKIVKKCAALAELQKAQDSLHLGELQGEALGFVQQIGVDVTKGRHVLTESRSQETLGDPTGVTVTMQWQLEEIGVHYEVLNSWDFNPLDYTQKQRLEVSAWLLMNNPGSYNLVESKVDSKKLRKFVDLAGLGYIENTFHNFSHGVDVTHTSYRYLTLQQMEQVFSQAEEFALLVAALCHDIGHIGFNNGFLTETQQELAVRYNDKSPLENMHCCKLFEIIASNASPASETSDLFGFLTHQQYKEVRKLIIDVILHTDISKHMGMVKELALLFELNSKIFEEGSNVSGEFSEAEIDALLPKKMLIAELVIHASDISNPVKPWEVCERWAYLCLEEYFNQGDEEKRLGLPVQMLNDRDKVNRPNSQIGFIEFIIAPMVSAEVRLFAAWFESSILLEENITKWYEKWVEEVTPQPEEMEKVQSRVHRIGTSLNNEKYFAILQDHEFPSSSSKAHTTQEKSKRGRLSTVSSAQPRLALRVSAPL